MTWLASSGMTLATFAPASPATNPTPDVVFQGFVDTKATFILSPPALFGRWAQEPEKLEFLARAKGLMYGGKFLSKIVGDQLAAAGANIFNMYGMTEVGLVSSFLPDSLGMDWEYFGLNPHLATEFVPNGDGTYDLIIVSKPTQELLLKNTKFHGQDAYNTGDVLVPHPSLAGYWRVLGRTDDQIMLTTGDTVNPCPLEDILCQDPKIGAVVMFGRGRPQTGVIIEPPTEAAIDPSDAEKLAEFRDAIWPKVEQMNAIAPQHGRLAREMIMVTSPSKPFTYTGKGAPRRAIIQQEYRVEIDSLYSAYGASTKKKAPIAPIVSL